MGAEMVGNRGLSSCTAWRDKTSIYNRGLAARMFISCSSNSQKTREVSQTHQNAIRPSLKIVLNSTGTKHCVVCTGRQDPLVREGVVHRPGMIRSYR